MSQHKGMALRVTLRYLSASVLGDPTINDPRYDRLEKELENAYRRHAPQAEIDRLEMDLSKWVSEEDPQVSEEDVLYNIPAASEGISIDEELISLYDRYLKTPDPVKKQELVGTMRGVVDGSDYIYMYARPSGNLTDEQILDAAKDVHEHRLHLNKKRGMPRINPTPEKAVAEFHRIRERMKPTAI